MDNFIPTINPTAEQLAYLAPFLDRDGYYDLVALNLFENPKTSWQAAYNRSKLGPGIDGDSPMMKLARKFNHIKAVAEGCEYNMAHRRVWRQWELESRRQEGYIIVDLTIDGDTYSLIRDALDERRSKHKQGAEEAEGDVLRSYHITEGKRITNTIIELAEAEYRASHSEQEIAAWRAMIEAENQTMGAGV